MAEEIVWQGRPSPRAQLPTFVALVLGAGLATAGLLFVGGHDRAAEGERSIGALVPWLVALTWVVCAVGLAATYLASRATRYVLTSERLRVTTGLLSTTTNEVELRRVRDTTVLRPALLRTVGLGHVLLVSADASTPTQMLRAVEDPEGVQARVRELVQAAYRARQVREIDVL